MGTGTMMSISNKLGLVKNRLNETEIASVGELFPKCAWFRYFRIAQGEGGKRKTCYSKITKVVSYFIRTILFLLKKVISTCT